MKSLKPVPIASLSPADRHALEAIRKDFLDRTDTDGDGGAEWVREALSDEDVRWWPHEIRSWGWDDVDDYSHKVAKILLKYKSRTP